MAGADVVGGALTMWSGLRRFWSRFRHPTSHGESSGMQLETTGVGELGRRRLPVSGWDDGRFVVGANLPWIDYGTDFGTSCWHPSGGLSGRPDCLDRLDRTLAQLAADGIDLARFFLLCDGRSGIRFDRDGLPIALDEEVFIDMDALLATAARHGVPLMPVLLDFHLCKPAQTVNGLQLSGRERLVSTEVGRRALIEVVLKPIVERFGTHELIAAWDVFNEPEWCLQMLSRTGGAFDALQSFLKSAVDTVRAASTQPVTVGSAGTWQLDLVRPLGLDFYQIHWYERFGWASLERQVSTLNLDAPTILGEFSGRSAGVSDVLHTARRAGYAGALVWSVLAEDDQSGYTPEIATWARTHSRGPLGV
jgi:hypothetical protein